MHSKSTLRDVKTKVYKNNELLQETENLSNGSFKLTLELGSVYNVSFLKNDYVEKSIAVVAKTDSSISISGRFFYQLDIELFKEDDGVIDQTALPPVAKLYINEESTGFTYDKKYVKWVAKKYKEESE
ncbi:MAG: putative membrane protein YfhO [Vicingaceae bacterium]